MASNLVAMPKRGPYSRDSFIDWQCPPVEAGGYVVKGWIDELIQNGTRWAKAQEGTKTMQRDIRLLLGLDQDNSMKSNMLMPNIRTFVETISDLRQIATLGVKAEQYKQYAQTYNQALKHVYWDSEYVYNIRRALQWAMPGGSGFIWCHFSRPDYGWGRGKTRYTDLGPYEVLPEQLPYDHDLQQAYAVSVIVPMPVAEAHARFPEFQEWLVPISRYDWKQYGSTVGLILDHWDSTRFNGQWAWENRYCLIRRTWIRDLRINETKRHLQMGVPGSTWGYTVPSYGDLLTSVNPLNGLPQSRKADESDCRVYPQLRQIITCPTVPVPMYDDTAFDNHGTIPVVQFDVNDWPWAARGYSAVRQVAGVERGRRARASEMDAIMAVRHDPPLGYDFTSGVSRTQLEKLDFLASQGIRAGVKGDPKKAMQSMLPDSMDIAEYDWKGQEWYDSIIKSTLGLADIASMRDLKMNVSDQSFDKFITNLGPMAKGIAFVMWRASSRLGMMTASNISQYVPVEELISWIGPEAVDLEVFDNDPTSLTPSHLPGELIQHESSYTKAQRARWFLQRLGIISTPMQLLDITQMQEKMLYMFLYQKGAQIPQAVYMDKFGVQNYEAQKQEWREEQLNDAVWQIKVKIAIAKEAQKAAQEAGIDPQALMGGEEGGKGKGQGKGGGRPNSMEKPPHAGMKGSQSGNVRAVNKTS